MILLTDHYGNPCMVNPEYLSLAYIPQKETETQLLLSDGTCIYVKETPTEIRSIMYEDDKEDEEDVFDPWQPMKEVGCATCLYEDTEPDEPPCDECVNHDLGSEDGRWAPKKTIHPVHTGGASND